MLSFFKSKKNSSDETALLPFRTDIHCHVLPGIDDGSPDTETSIALIRGMKEIGIERIFATPHIAYESFPNTRETIEKAYQTLMVALEREGIDVQLTFAAEHRLDEGFERLLEREEVLCFPDRVCLIENSFVFPYMGLEQTVFSLHSMGIQPVLAHPERYTYYLGKKEVFQKLQQQNCFFQVNLLSFSGYYGANVAEAAKWLLSQGMVQFIGTDIHNLGHIELIKQFMQSRDYKKLVGSFDHLLNDNLGD